LPEEIDRRSFLARGVLGAAGVAAGVGGGSLLAACSSGSKTPSASGPRNGITNSTPKRGGSLVFGVEAEQSSIDPSAARFDESGVLYARAVYDPLTIIAADGSVQPYLAQSVTPNADHTQWTIAVRSGVTFHDGTPCDAQAIANSMNHIIDGELGTIAYKPVVQSVVATDPQTVTVNLKQSWVPFDYYLAGGIGGQIGYVVAPSVIAQASGSGQVTPVGTGPFKYVSWVPNDHFELKRNENYWRPGLPYLDSLTYRPIVDSDSRSNSLMAGTIDIMHTDVAPIIQQYSANESYGFVDDLSKVTGEPDMDFAMLNLQKAPMNDIRVRKAMAMAIDLQAYRAVVNHNLNPVSTQLFVEGTPYYKPTSYPSYNPTAAKSLVQEYQSATGHPVSFTFGSTTSAASVQAAELLQSQWQKAGMHVSLSQFQQADLINNALAGSFDVYEWRQFAAVDPDLNYIFWSPTTIYGGGALATNFARNNDQVIELYLQQGRTSADPAARASAYQQVAERFAQDLPYIFYDRAVWSIVANAKVQNFNNPTTPSGAKAYGMIVGTIWPTQIWLAA
jgi:peptide/nickel transport system substrate-binding protein